MAVRETAQGMVFLRQVVAGGASKSYGLHVARLAGLPDEVVAEATRVLAYLEQQRATPTPRVATNGSQGEPALSRLTEQLLALDVCQITPLQALTLLHQLHQQARSLTGHGRDSQ
jgi:DNA mismatch repair protein MutS